MKSFVVDYHAYLHDSMLCLLLNKKIQKKCDMTACLNAQKSITFGTIFITFETIILFKWSSQASFGESDMYLTIQDYLNQFK